MNNAASETAVGCRKAARIRIFTIGITLFCGWVAVLIWLVATASNPVVINVAQLLNADCVVVADLTDPESGEFTRVTTIAGFEPPESFRVRGLSEVNGPESPHWMLALKQERGGDYSIVPVPYRDQHLLLVYPGDDDVVAQAKNLLGIE